LLLQTISNTDSVEDFFDEKQNTYLTCIQDIIKEENYQIQLLNDQYIIKYYCKKKFN